MKFNAIKFPIIRHNKKSLNSKHENITFNRCLKMLGDINCVEKELVRELVENKVKRPMIFAGPNVYKLGFVDKITDICKDGGIDNVAVFADVLPESPIENIKQAFTVFKASYCDGIIAIGGGSVIDTAKVVKAMMSTKESNIEKLYGYHGIRDGLSLPLIVIPTTIGVGNESTNIAVIFDKETNHKNELVSNVLLPTVALIDPSFTKTLPLNILFTGVFDTLTHTIEGMTGRQMSALQRHIGYRVLRLIKDNFEKSITDLENMQARQKLMVAGSMAGVIMQNSMVGSVHALAHAIGVVLDVPHSMAVSKCLTLMMRNNLSSIDGEYSMILFFLAGEDIWQNIHGNKDEACIDYIDSLYHRIEKIVGKQKTLVEYGLKPEVFDTIVDKFLADGAALSNVRTTTNRDVYEILAKLVEEDR